MQHGVHPPSMLTLNLRRCDRLRASQAWDYVQRESSFNLPHADEADEEEEEQAADAGHQTDDDDDGPDDVIQTYTGAQADPHRLFAAS